MKRLVFFFTLLGNIAAADELRDIEKELEIVIRRAELAAKRQELEATKLRTAQNIRATQIALKEAAIAKAEQEKTERMLNLPSIIINAGRIETAADPNKLCDATNFLRFHCHRSHSCAEFTVDNSICALPARETVPMVLSVNFSCGQEIRNITIPFGENAWVTCK